MTLLRRLAFPSYQGQCRGASFFPFDGDRISLSLLKGLQCLQRTLHLGELGILVALVASHRLGLQRLAFSDPALPGSALQEDAMVLLEKHALLA